MASRAARARSDDELLAVNHDFYEALWTDAKLVAPQCFNTWPLVEELAAQSRRALEVGPGLRPRLPLAGTCFVDLSGAAVHRIREAGANATTGLIGALPFADASFDLVCAFDIVEHVDDDAAALSELARVAAPGAALLLSVPLHESAWTGFDDFVGHRRRYEPHELNRKLRHHGFSIERSAVHGMQPESPRLVDLGMWFLVHRRERAMWWYNRVIMPLGLRMQKPLRWQAGLIDAADVDTVVLVCRKDAAVPTMGA
jgi:SAM-dependent methyltransferase